MSSEKVYMITGASSGIGVGISESLVKSGVRKLVLVARRKELLDQVAKTCKDLGADEVLGLAKDLSDLKTAPEVVNETIEKFGRIDVLINNAGQYDMSHTVIETSDELIRKIFDLNFFGAHALTREALPHIRKTKGNILFMSSVAAHHGFPNSSSYNCSKAALTMLAKTLALEEAANGVRVNLVSPGAIMTDMLRMFKEEGKTEAEFLEIASKRSPLLTVGQVEDIANAVVYLTDEKTGRFVTGTDLVVDGGKLLNPLMGR